MGLFSAQLERLLRDLINTLSVLPDATLVVSINGTKLTVSPSGHVAIGSNPNPQFPLTFDGVTGKKIALYVDSGGTTNFFGFEVASGELRSWVNNDPNGFFSWYQNGGEISRLSPQAFNLPHGTTAQRPTGVDGMIRFNSDLNRVESFYSGVWNSL